MGMHSLIITKEVQIAYFDYFSKCMRLLELCNKWVRNLNLKNLAKSKWRIGSTILGRFSIESIILKKGSDLELKPSITHEATRRWYF